MGQNWWWVAVLAVAVLAPLIAVVLLRARHRRVDAVPSSDVEIAAAAVGGAAGTDSPGTAAASRTEEPAPNGEAREPGGPRSPEDEEPEPSGAPPKIPDQRRPEPADSALAALDTGLAGSATSFVAAAAAVSAVTARPGPYPGSLLPAADGSAPSPDHLVKANEGSRRYHTPDSPYYVRTRGDTWFRTAEEARAAGFTSWDAAR